MEFKYIDSSLQQKWKDFTKKTPSTGFMQSFFWAEFTAKLGWQTFKIGVFKENELIGGAAITKFISAEGFNYLYIPEGPVLDYESKDADKIFNGLIEEIDKIADLKGDKLTSHLRIEPRLTELPDFFKRFTKSITNQEPLRTLMIDLFLSEKQLLEQMKPKGRYNIKIAQRYKIEVVSINPKDGLTDFLKFYKQTVKRNNFEGQQEEYFIKLFSTFIETGVAKLFFAKYKDKIIATALVIFYGDKVTYLFGASSDFDREKMAPYLLQWEIITKAKAFGFRWYDLYGIVPDENDLSHPWQGFSNFKKKLGGIETKYIGGYDFVYNKKLYQQYQKENEL